MELGIKFIQIRRILPRLVYIGLYTSLLERCESHFSLILYIKSWDETEHGILEASAEQTAKETNRVVNEWLQQLKCVKTDHVKVHSVSCDQSDQPKEVFQCPLCANMYTDSSAILHHIHGLHPDWLQSENRKWEAERHKRQNNPENGTMEQACIRLPKSISGVWRTQLINGIEHLKDNVDMHHKMNEPIQGVPFRGINVWTVGQQKLRQAKEEPHGIQSTGNISRRTGLNGLLSLQQNIPSRFLESQLAPFVKRPYSTHGQHHIN